MALNGIITQEGISKSIDVANNEGFEIRPYKFAVSESVGLLDASRTINDLEPVWYEGSISAFIKIDDNTVQFNCNIPAEVSPNPKFTTEIYLIATDGVDDFLLAFVQPTSELTYDPEGELRIRFQVSSGEVEIANLYNFNYTQATEIEDHNSDSNAHPSIQEALKDFGIYVNSPNEFKGQFIDRFPVMGPSVGDRQAVYWNTITARYEQSLATDPISKNALGVYLADRDTVVYEGIVDFVNASPPYTKVYLSTSVAGLLTLSPSDTIIGYTLPNNKIFISIDVATDEVESVDPDGNKTVILEPPLARTLVLQDANEVNWDVLISNDGILSTEISADEPSPLFKITKQDLSFGEIRIDITGQLFVQSPPVDNSILADDFYYIQSPDGTYWKFTLDLANQIVMSTFDNTYSVVADNGSVLFDVTQTDPYKALSGVQTYDEADLPSPPPSTGTQKYAFADVGDGIILPVYWDNSKWERYGSGMIGDLKYSYLPDAKFEQLHGSGWVRAKGQNIVGSKLHELVGATHLAEGRGPVIRGIVDIDPIEFNPADVDITNDIIFVPNHGYNTGMKIKFTTTGGIMGGINANTANNEGLSNLYFVIVVDANNIKVATSFADAHSDVAVNITSQGSGVHTLLQRQDPDERYNTSDGSSENEVGAWQDDQYRRHRHSHQTVQHNSFIYGQPTGAQQGTFNGGTAGDPAFLSYTSIEGGSETRMTNIAAYLYVKIN